MSAFVGDTSALIAILANEADARDFMIKLDADAMTISAATLHEAYCVVRRESLRHGVERLDRLIELVVPEIAPFDARQLDVTKQAYSLYGRGSGHAANLNMGDCFAYALAKTRNLPLLFKGDDFVHTDIVPALKRI